MVVSREKICGHIVVLIILLTYLYLITDGKVDFYNQFAFPINLFASGITFFLVKEYKNSDIIFFCISMIYMILSLILTRGGIGSCLTFIIPIIWLFVIEKMYVSFYMIKVIRMLSLTTMIMVFWHSLKYAGKNIYTVYTNVNANTMGMISLYACCLFLALSINEGVKFIFEEMLCFFIEGMIMINCSSRMSLIAMLLFIIFSLIPSCVITKKRWKMLFLFIVIMGTLVPYVYLALYKRGIELTLFGKSLYTGREYIWANMFFLMNKNPIFYLVGMGSKATVWNNAMNIHNNYFNMVVNFGIIGYLLFFGYLYRKIGSIRIKRESKNQQLLLTMFFVNVLVYGFTETTSLWAFSFVLAYLGLGLALNQSFVEQMNKMCKKKKK